MKCIRTQFFRKIELQVLILLTANGFQVPPYFVGFCKYRSSLQRYAIFTRECRKCVPSEREKAVKRKLYQNAWRAGIIAHYSTFWMTEARRWQLVRALYRNIAIDIVTVNPETLQVRRCFFSQYYDPSTCQFISALDDGLMSGFLGGGKVTFQRRITEGACACEACFYAKIEF